MITQRLFPSLAGVALLTPVLGLHARRQPEVALRLGARLEVHLLPERPRSPRLVPQWHDDPPLLQQRVGFVVRPDPPHALAVVFGGTEVSAPQLQVPLVPLWED